VHQVLQILKQDLQILKLGNAGNSNNLCTFADRLGNAREGAFRQSEAEI